MARIAVEFYCHCGYYNYPMLSEDFCGNCTVLCGHCGHEHYRAIKNGVVTEDRHSETMGTAVRLHIMPSACQKEPRKRGLVAQLRELASAGLAE